MKQKNYKARQMARDINEIIIHCSDSDVKAHDNVKTIRKWHKARGFSDIGYHFVVTKEGIKAGRPVAIQGAHCKGHNNNTIGICVTGRDWFTIKQMNNLTQLVDLLKMIYPIEKVSPHYKYNTEKSCPNFQHELFGSYQ